MSRCSYNPVRQEARDNLAKAARRLRALRGTPAEKELEWAPVERQSSDWVCFARLGRGRLILRPHKSTYYSLTGEVEWASSRVTGVHYTSSFGPDSERSFSGYLPGLTLEEAKLLVYHAALPHW